MPVHLPDDMLADWLAPGKLEQTEREHLHADLGAASEAIARDLVTYPVDRKVNSTRSVDRTDPTLIEPIDLA